MMQNQESEDGLYEFCEELDLDFGSLCDVCREFGIDPEVPIESGEYFKILLARYVDESREDLKPWLRENISRDFISFGSRPIWIQGACWLFQAGLPMIFAGQLDIKASAAGGYFHDDASIYIFLPQKSSDVETVIQSY